MQALIYLQITKQKASTGRRFLELSISTADLKQISTNTLRYRRQKLLD
jgi:hypothetical protein